MHAGPQRAAAFAVNDAYAEDAAFPTFDEVLGKQAADFIWPERVQIEFRADGMLHEFGNGVIIGSGHDSA